MKLPSGSRSSWTKALALPAGLVMMFSLLAAPSPSGAQTTPAIAEANGAGYWMVASDGGVFSFGDAGYFGSLGGTKLNKPITGILPTPSGEGYWMVASDGGIFAFGDAPYYGSAGALKLNQPIVGMAAKAPDSGFLAAAGKAGPPGPPGAAGPPGLWPSSSRSTALTMARV